MVVVVFHPMRPGPFPVIHAGFGHADVPFSAFEAAKFSRGHSGGMEARVNSIRSGRAPGLSQSRETPQNYHASQDCGHDSLDPGFHCFILRVMLGNPALNVLDDFSTSGMVWLSLDLTNGGSKC
jgi:hypothetical protein